MMNRNKFKWLVEFTVDRAWVEDGFDLTDDRALDMLAHDLSYANIGTELDARVIMYADAQRVARAQGYKNCEEVAKEREKGRNHPQHGNLLAALRCAHAKLDSVAFLVTEGDTNEIKADLNFWIDSLCQ